MPDVKWNAEVSRCPASNGTPRFPRCVRRVTIGAAPGDADQDGAGGPDSPKGTQGRQTRQETDERRRDD